MILAAMVLLSSCNLYRKYKPDYSVRNDVMGDVVNPQVLKRKKKKNKKTKRKETVQ